MAPAMDLRLGGSMPYWSIYCLYCSEYIIDALLECVPMSQRSNPAFDLLLKAQPGAALACPYCNALFGLDANGQPQAPQRGWPVFRYGKAELEIKKVMDGEPLSTALADWASSIASRSRAAIAR